MSQTTISRHFRRRSARAAAERYERQHPLAICDAVKSKRGPFMWRAVILGFRESTRSDADPLLR